MKVIVVGAGIAGLSLAISLGQAGHQVILLESAPALAEIGAGVQMTPNAIKCFFNLGLKDDLMAKSAIPGHMNIRHGKQGHVLGSITIRDFERDYGAPYILIHRAILHDILHKHALKAGAEVKVNSKVVQYLFDSGTVVLSSGEELSADLVVAADGINSFARSQLLGPLDPCTAPTGWAGYRMMAEVSTIRTTPSLAGITVNSSHDSNLWIGPHQSAMTYLIKDGKMLNIVLSHRDDVDTSEWSIQRYQEEVTSMFADWDPMLRQLLDIALPKIVNYPVHRIPPLERWVHESGRFCLLGDAAHAMAFYLSMGVSLAVEDSVALTEALELARTAAGGARANVNAASSAPAYSRAKEQEREQEQQTLKTALHLFERVRKPRAEAVQAASTHAGDVLHLEDGEGQEVRDEGLRRSREYWPVDDDMDEDGEGGRWDDQGNCKGETQGKGTRQWLYGLAERKTRDWCYGYDVKEAVRREWGMMRKDAGEEGVKTMGQ